MKTHNTMLVLTSKNMETMFMEGGCGFWRAKESSILSCRYVVATRNARSNWNQGNEEHGAAFMIGEISGVTRVDDRYIVRISRYALTDTREVWTPGGLNPIRYASLDETGIKLDSLHWKAWPSEEANKDSGLHNEIRPLTIAEAKTGLALSLGVDASSIEIIIRG
jgi:hypothetical protein